MRPTMLNLSVHAVLAALMLVLMSLSARAGEPVTPSTLDPRDSSWELCRQAAREVHQVTTLPAHLLAAISVTETGMTGRGRKTIAPWPWTINAAGTGYRFASKAEAVAATRKLLKDGVQSIDIGCMQVNLKYHPRAFTSLEEAFDPLANVAYAAQFLTHLKGLSKSWTKAIQGYHSFEPDDGQYYRGKVERIWAEEKVREARFVKRQKAASLRHLETLKTVRGTAVLASLGAPAEKAAQGTMGPAPRGLDAPLRSVLVSAETVRPAPRPAVRQGRPGAALALALKPLTRLGGETSQGATRRLVAASWRSLTAPMTTETAPSDARPSAVRQLAVYETPQTRAEPAQIDATQGVAALR